MKSESRGLITIRVVNHLPIGLGVETEDGQYGIVRVREISWDANRLANWKQNHPLDWSGKASVLPNKKDQVKEFSLRLAESDPWEGVPKILEKGKVYEGIVTGILGFGIFVEIASGVTGLLHRSQLPAWIKSSPTDLFWPGDRVYVNVQEINYNERKINLGFPESTRQPEFSDTTETVQLISGKILNDHEVNVLLKEKTGKKHFLVVEDDPEQSSTITSWLRHLGQQVDVVARAEDALLFFEKTTPDIAIIDVGLPKMNGVELSSIILGRWPQIRVIITTDWAQAENVMEGLDELQQRQAELLIKPMMPEDLIGIIKKEKAKQTDGHIEDKNPEPVKFTTQQTSNLRTAPFHKNLLDRLRSYLGYDLVILFALDRNHRQVSIREYSGDETRINITAIPQLIYSPVRDVAEDQGMLTMNDVQAHNRDRFRYLLELYPDLRACIGVPIASQITSDFALFALNSHPHQIGQEQKMFAEAVALTIGTSLNQKSFNERSVLIQRSALIGHLTRGMVHEINNLVGPLHSRLDTLQQSLKQVEKEKDSLDLSVLNRKQILEELGDIQNNARKIINTTRMFGRIAAKSKNEVLRVDEIVDETIHFMRDISHQSRVKITFTHPDQLLVIKNQAAALEQVLLNVLLNAVQQIAESHPEAGGWVHVQIDLPYEKNGQNFFGLKVEDNGPGIHAVLWDKVFEAGYTTRQDGSGIGLYISQNLMEEIGGRIYVEKSHILSGTTFGLEIPYHL
jgi:signal transduction histidine kinase/predicted RNA-binding protein with RPS1 domain